MKIWQLHFNYIYGYIHYLIDDLIKLILNMIVMKLK